MKIVGVLEDYADTAASEEKAAAKSEGSINISVIEVLLILLETLIEVDILLPSNFMAVNLLECLQKSLKIFENQQI